MSSTGKWPPQELKDIQAEENCLELLAATELYSVIAFSDLINIFNCRTNCGTVENFLSNFRSPFLSMEKKLGIPRNEDSTILTAILSIFKNKKAPNYHNQDILLVSKNKPDAKKPTSPMDFFEDTLDSFQVLHNYLKRYIGNGQDSSKAPISPRAWEQIIQLGFRHAFHFHYEQEKLPLYRHLCEWFNLRFFGDNIPSLRKLRTTQEKIMKVQDFIEELKEEIKKYDENADKLAFALFFAIRFSRQIRMLYIPNSRKGKEVEKPLNFMYFRVIRPIQFGFFLAKTFGAQSGIFDLNYVFRGGLLPSADKGRGRVWQIMGDPGSAKSTFALNLMADMAIRGRVAVYFPFEEHFEDIKAKLISLGMYNEDDYLLVGFNSNNLDAKIMEWYSQHQKHHNSTNPIKPYGLLLVYQKEPHTEASLDELVEILSEKLQPFQWRALTIDSLNAFYSSWNVQEAGRLKVRFDVLQLIEAISRSGFWGIVVNERDKEEEHKKISHIACTSIELGTDSKTGLRWMEIHKCREQPYHPGRHDFRITERNGIMVDPNLDSLCSTFRRRHKPGLGEPIPFTNETFSGFNSLDLLTNGNILIHGNPYIGKISTLLQEIPSPNEHERIAIFSFRLSKERFDYYWKLRFNGCNNNLLDSIIFNPISPGRDYSASRFLGDMKNMYWQQDHDGNKITYILLDGLEMVETSFPTMANEPLLWPATIEFLESEPITSFLIVNRLMDDEIIPILQGLVNYSLSITKEDEQMNIQHDPDFS